MSKNSKMNKKSKKSKIIIKILWKSKNKKEKKAKISKMQINNKKCNIRNSINSNKMSPDKPYRLNWL